MYKMEGRKHARKSSYNFAHTVTMQIVFLTVNILQGIYKGFLFILVIFFDSLLCKRQCKKEADMMMLGRTESNLHPTESNLQGFKDFKIQTYSEINMKLWVLFSSGI